MHYNKDIVVKWFAEHRLLAVPEFRFHTSRKWRFDFIVTLFDMPIEPTSSGYVALEVQGGLFSGGRHSRGPALLKEHEKLNEAACLGWRVLYCIPQTLCMQETVDMVKRALAI